MRIGILVSHPIQYYTPLFRVLAQRVDLSVFYATRGSPTAQARAGFGVEFDWDVDLLSGYDHVFLHNVAATPSPNTFWGCDTPEISAVIKSGNFDAFIVFGWYLKAHWQAIRACRRCNVPVLVRGDSQLRTPRSALKKAVKRQVYRVLLRQFDGFLTVGKRNREYLLHYGVSDRRLFFSPHFVDNAFFAAGAQQARARRSDLRAQWSCDDGSVVVLFVGKFLSLKRPTDIIRALALLNAERRETVAVFVGAGGIEGEIQRAAQELNVRACFAGFRNQTELPAYYSAADVLVLPSASETWGLVVNEAMACGLPAIVSDAVGCAPDLIDEGNTGFTFPAGDVHALADVLRTFISLLRQGHSFETALSQKMQEYSVEAAAIGVTTAVQSLIMPASCGAK